MSQHAAGTSRSSLPAFKVAPRAASKNIARTINRDIILEMLRRYQPIARVDLARLSGLQRSTVSAIVEALIEEKWVREGAIEKTARGRQPTMLSLNPDLALLVADIRPGRASIAAIDLAGKMLAISRVRISEGPKESIKTIVREMSSIRDGLATAVFEGIGISLPGRVEVKSKKLLIAPNLGWSNVDIKTAVERRLRLNVVLDNAANACMLSELWYGHLDGTEDAVLITVSEGLGTAIFANGQLIEGGGAAGEFGHVPIDRSGPKCKCGGTGCWETFASTTALLRFFAEADPKHRSVTIEEFHELSAAENTSARSAIERQALHLGEGLKMITAGLNPAVILFAGDIAAHWNLSMPVIRAVVKRELLTGLPPRLICIGDGETARLRGAAALVLQRHATYRRLA